ncbi:U1 zinc finger [Musa troglodytarum]|uniref:U1 zinc finger n=1 Tax=Musa troglodytarum TaxID=320322 RepID=A0A9E7EZX5_9LILI|nr:U1 zinc finger [Musa troglodytarum]
MPLGKYYCDYCDKQFQDTPAARKRHLQGLHHHRARALWYDSFKGLFLSTPRRTAWSASFPTLRKPGQRRLPPFCPHGKILPHLRLILRESDGFEGVCKYRDACKYFHPKQDVLNPTPSVTGMKHMEAIQFQNSLASNLPGDSMSGNIINQAGISWGNLPLSLRPPPEGGYPPLLFLDWG